jgi:hypothetical protein
MSVYDAVHALPATVQDRASPAADAGSPAAPRSGTITTTTALARTLPVFVTAAVTVPFADAAPPVTDTSCFGGVMLWLRVAAVDQDAVRVDANTETVRLVVN